MAGSHEVRGSNPLGSTSRGNEAESSYTAQLQQMASEAVSASVRCSDCGAELEQIQDGAGRWEVVDGPCPVCGSAKRTHHVQASAGTFHLTGGDVTLRVTRVWDSSSLTLFAAIYAVLVTVAGVVVAMVGVGGSWLWWAIYAVASIGILAVAMLLLPQFIIGAMRWLVDRAKNAPSWPR